MDIERLCIKKFSVFHTTRLRKYGGFRPWVGLLRSCGTEFVSQNEDWILHSQLLYFYTRSMMTPPSTCRQSVEWTQFTCLLITYVSVIIMISNLKILTPPSHRNMQCACLDPDLGSLQCRPRVHSMGYKKKLNSHWDEFVCSRAHVTAGDR
jgi:hypothetical protein